MAATMLPEVDYGTYYEVDSIQGTEYIPLDVFNLDDYLPSDKPDTDVQVTIRLIKGYFARLSMPGYLDCTDWQGPYESEKEALADLASSYDVCPECWEQCWEMDESDCSIRQAELKEQNNA